MALIGGCFRAEKVDPPAMRVRSTVYSFQRRKHSALLSEYASSLSDQLNRGYGSGSHNCPRTLTLAHANGRPRFLLPESLHGQIHYETRCSFQICMHNVPWLRVSKRQKSHWHSITLWPSSHRPITPDIPSVESVAYRYATGT